MDTFILVTALVFISAVFSYLNLRFLKLPGTIGILTVAIVVSVGMLLSGKLVPSVTRAFIMLSEEIDFTRAVLDIMLGFLLFAGSLHFDMNKLRENRGAVFTLSTLGVLVSTAIFAALFYLIAHLFHHDIPVIYCLVFGALISPTDPVAVASVIKQSKIPPRLQTIITGESLFNDGVGIVLFVTLSELARQTVRKLDLYETATLFLQEVGGGILLGLVLSFICVKLIRRIDDFQTTMLLTLSLVMGISVVASMLHFSSPLAQVAAGLYLGNQKLTGQQGAYSTEDILQRVWSLIDDMLNTVFFVLIGIQLVTMPFLTSYWFTGIAAFLAVVFSRLVSISLPVMVLRRKLKIKYNAIFILTWAGLRGGISIALALSLPDSDYRELILSASYFIVIISILLQGLTLNRVSNRLIGADAG